MVKWPKFRPKIWDLGIPWGPTLKRGDFVSGTDRLSTIMQNFTPFGVTVAEMSVKITGSDTNIHTITADKTRTLALRLSIIAHSVSQYNIYNIWAFVLISCNSAKFRPNCVLCSVHLKVKAYIVHTRITRFGLSSINTTTTQKCFVTVRINKVKTVIYYYHH